MTLKVALKKKGFDCHLQRIGLHECMIHMFGILMMIWLQICSPFKDDLLQHTQSDLQSSLDTYPFEDAYLFYEDFQPLCSDFDRHQVMASPKKSEVHTTKHEVLSC
jgi:hypothetical protein